MLLYRAGGVGLLNREIVFARSSIEERAVCVNRTYTTCLSAHNLIYAARGMQYGAINQDSKYTMMV